MSVTGSMRFRVPFSWRIVTASDLNDWPFREGAETASNLSTTCFGCRIYRFFFHAGDRGPSCYISEAEKFERRILKYLSAVRRERVPTPAAESKVLDWPAAVKRLNTDPTVRVAARIINSEATNSRVELALLEFEGFSFNDAPLSPQTLANPFVRRAIENLAIV